MINIESAAESSPILENSPSQNEEQVETVETGANEDKEHDKYVKNILKDLAKVGPHSKQILNYSYPPLLY